MKSEKYDLVKTLNCAITGLGRQGRRHALNIVKQHNANLIAACTIDPDDFKWAAEHIPEVKIYTDLNELLSKHKGEINAIVVSSSTSEHLKHSRAGLEAGLHVLCEKPLSTNADEIEEFLEYRKLFPRLICAVGFSRRFDPSIKAAKIKCDKGLLGENLVYRGWTLDQYEPSGFFVAYAAQSGGIFVDCSVHDIDTTFYFCGENLIPKKCFAIGSAKVYPGLIENNDRDNALGLVEYQNGLVAHYYASRTMPHGHDTAIELTGTKGKATINIAPKADKAMFYTEVGASYNIEADYWERFEEAFSQEMKEFTEACTLGHELPLKLETSLVVSRIGNALQKSMLTGKAIDFDKNGIEIIPK